MLHAESRVQEAAEDELELPEAVLEVRCCVPRLVEPTLDRLPSYLAMLDRTLALGETGDGFALNNPVSTRKNPAGFVRLLHDWAVGRNLPDGIRAANDTLARPR